MIRTLILTSALVLAQPAFAQEHDHQGDHADHQHDDHDHQGHETVEDGEAAPIEIALSRTPVIETALNAGGQPVVVEVLGVVCDFCAKAMNKTFGKRDEVSAVYVDLDTKTLNLILVSCAEMPAAAIERQSAIGETASAVP